jgi:hypothetical protein
MKAQPKPKTPAKTTGAPEFRVVGGKGPATAKTSGTLDFGGLVKPATKKVTPSHPILSLQGEGLELLGQYADAAEQYKPLEKLVGPKGSIKAQLRPHLIDAYFRLFAGRALDESRCHTHTHDGREIKTTFKEQYSKLCTELATLLKAVPRVEPHVQMVNTLKIEFDKISAEKQQPFVDAIIASQPLNLSTVPHQLSRSSGRRRPAGRCAAQGRSLGLPAQDRRLASDRSHAHQTHLEPPRQTHVDRRGARSCS